MNKLVETLLIFIPLSFLILFAGIYLGGEIWAKGKIVLGDILNFFGWASKSIRKFFHYLQGRKFYYHAAKVLKSLNN